MHKNTLWLIFAVLCIYFSLVFCEESAIVQEWGSRDSNELLGSDTTALQDEARMRKKYHHHLYSLWGFYGLAVAYLIKIKVVVVAFFVGSAVYLGLRYLWPHKCGGGEIYKEGSIVLDHPPSFAHHDHIPYSLDHDHNYNSGPTSFEPYSAYSSQPYAELESSFPSGSYTGPDISPDSLPSDISNFRRKRSESGDFQQNKEAIGTLENLARQMVIKEEQIGDFMLNFLGLDTTACRRRFICEMEFKSRTNSLTSMAFRVIGRSFFAKYTNDRNPLREANSFEECAAANAECVFIENNEETEDKITTDGTEPTAPSAESQKQMETNEVKNQAESNDSIEEANTGNLKTELTSKSYRKRFRGERKLKMI